MEPIIVIAAKKAEDGRIIASKDEVLEWLTDAYDAGYKAGKEDAEDNPFYPVWWPRSSDSSSFQKEGSISTQTTYTAD